MPRASAWHVECGFNSTAQSAGLSVSETMTEMIVEAEMVTANCVKNRPEMPLMKAAGTNTAHNVNAMAMSAVDTSSIVLCAASLRSPCPAPCFAPRSRPRRWRHRQRCPRPGSDRTSTDC